MSESVQGGARTWRDAPQPGDAKASARASPFDLWAAMMTGRVTAATAGRRGSRLMAEARRIEALEKNVRDLSDDALRRKIMQQRQALRNPGSQTEAAIQTFALLREAAARTLGLRHHANQLAAGLALLRGMLAELEGGEGKTVTAALAAATGALAGRWVHVVTVNDYLAARDAEIVRPFYRYVGLSVDVATGGQDPVRRKRAYRADVAYVTNKELAFDHLRDRLEFGRDDHGLRHHLRRLCSDAAFEARRIPALDMAIVDEADSILVDEARTPLVISAEASAQISKRDLHTALADAGRLLPNVHFRLRPVERTAELLEAGRRELALMSAGRAGPWRIPPWREQLVQLALTAQRLFSRGVEYRVRAGRIEVVDEFTGRVMPDRAFGAGLHELLAVKEGLEPQGQRTEQGRLTYQRLFRRYRRLAGMTGTAREVGAELWGIYRLPVARLPTHRPLERLFAGAEVLSSGEERWERIAGRTLALQALGRPVLVGTRTLAASQAASAALDRSGVAHVVLNADQDSDEAAIVAAAGQVGQVTVATNMAGRGTDIKLDQRVAALGGLHVIMSELHESARIDRQLAARCARQGDPGSWEAILSFEDPLLAAWLSPNARRLGPLMPPRWRSRLGYALMKLAQARAEARHARARRELLLADERLDDFLAFAGRRE